MWSLVILLALAAAGSAVGSPGNSFDNIDLDQFQTEEQIANLIKCGIEKALISGCNEDVIRIINRAEEFLTNNCADCTPNEKQAIAYLTKKIASSKNGASDIPILLKTYDVTGKYSKTFLEATNKFETKQKVPKIPEFIINLFNNIKDLKTPTKNLPRPKSQDVTDEDGVLGGHGTH